MSDSSGDHITGNIAGNISGQVAVGKNIAQRQQAGQREALTEAEWAELQQLFADVKAQVPTEVPDDQQAPALERFQEFEDALTAEEPDLTTVDYVKRWFLKRLPGFAGVITGVLVNPLVGKLVQSAGDAFANELARVASE